MGVWGKEGTKGVVEGELNLLKKLLAWFALSRLPDVSLSFSFILVMFFIPLQTSLILFCSTVLSTVVVLASPQHLSEFMLNSPSVPLCLQT